MINKEYFELYETMLHSADSYNRRLAYGELLHYYKENEAVYYRTLSKSEKEWSPAQHHFIQRMEKIKTLLEL